MTRRFPIIACLVLTLISGGMLEQMAAAQPQGEVLDLANVPLTADAYPEPGYQILTGGYLDHGATVEQIAPPERRGERDRQHVDQYGHGTGLYAGSDAS